MPILTTCECGHEITVADSMAGKKGRCPKCDAVIAIPERKPRPRRGGAFARPPREKPARAFGGLAAFSTLLMIVGLLSLLAFAGIGVYSGVKAFRAPASFQGPFGLFSDCAATVQESPVPTGIAFIVGGLMLGGLSALVLTAVGQCLRVFLSIEGSLGRIADHLSDGD